MQQHQTTHLRCHTDRNTCLTVSGFIDVYNDERESVGEHGARILQVRVNVAIT